MSRGLMSGELMSKGANDCLPKIDLLSTNASSPFRIIVHFFMVEVENTTRENVFRKFEII